MKRVNNLPILKQRRKELRGNSTTQEELLWSRLRQSRSGFKFKRQHSIGPYILDFYCPEKRLAVELDGRQHVENKDYDVERAHYLREFGIKIVRFWNSEVDDNIEAALKRIMQELNLRPAKGEVLGERRG